MKSFLHWMPRIASLLFVAFISIFALDVFGVYTGWQLAIALFMHLIPSILLLIAIAIAWKYDIVGAVIFVGFALWYMWNSGIEHWYWWPPIAGPALIVGISFLLDWLYGRGSEKSKLSS